SDYMSVITLQVSTAILAFYAIPEAEGDF
ncbi:MAG: hypothetical protein RL373_1255, partial [Pseudomonadota bacterium]